MSFLKHDPPKPMLAFRNLGPIRPSIPTMRATSVTSASVFSQTAETALMVETRWARKRLAASFASSLLQMLDVKIFSRGTQFA